MTAEQRLQRHLKHLRRDGAGQLQSVFGGQITLQHPARRYRRVFDPATTFWTFLSQVVHAGSCRNATREVQALREAHGQAAISSANAAYCQARQRLPLKLIEEQARHVAGKLQLSSQWDWRGRRVLLDDATSCQLPDTPKNQHVYPQPGGQKEGCGMPVMQLLGVFELGSGALLGWQKSPWFVHESGLFETAVLPHIREGDVLVADRAYDSYANLARLRMLGADAVFRMNARRNCPLKPGQQELVQSWKRPLKSARPEHYNPQEWDALPATQSVRYIRIDLRRKGFRTREVTLVTTLLDVPAEQIAALYLRRWQIEVCFRDIKTTLGMELLRGKSPAIAEREVAMHLLAYNLLRTLMLEAARQENQSLYQMSFAGARDATCRFAPVIANTASKRKRTSAIEELLRCIGTDPIPIRPDRVEPRAVKRRPKVYQLLNKPRQHMKVAQSRRLK